MQLSGKILAGTTTTLTTKAGAKLDKTRLKVLDMGDGSRWRGWQKLSNT